MATRAERASSFGSIAADYDRLRPSPAPEAVEWLVPQPCPVAVDLAAGTGLLTRELLGRADKVIAVEPDDRMREVLAARTPAAEVRNGTGEQIPLPDGSVDALFVASAWHWLDTARAVPEIARVLKDGGRLGVLWTSRDREIDWVRNLDRLPHEPQWDLAAGEDLKHWREASLPNSDPFESFEWMSFSYTRQMSPAEIVELTTTYSALITASDADWQAVLARTRATLAERSPAPPGSTSRSVAGVSEPAGSAAHRRNSAHLAEQADGVDLRPVLDDHAVDHPMNGDAFHGTVDGRRWHAGERASVLAAAPKPGDHVVAVSELIKQLVVPVREDLAARGERRPSPGRTGLRSLERRRVVVPRRCLTRRDATPERLGCQYCDHEECRSCDYEPPGGSRPPAPASAG